MKYSFRFWLVCLLALTAGGRLTAADVAGLPAFVSLMNAGADYHLGDTIQLELTTNNAFGQLVYQGLTNNRPTTMANLKLHLDGVPMAGLPVEAAAGTSASQVILRFTLRRDSSNADSRKSWDRLLDQIDYSDNQLPVAVSSGTDIAQMAAEKLKFSVATKPRGLGFGLLAFVLFPLLMWWAVAKGMLREAGPGTAYSLGRTQMAFWGLLVSLSFLAIFAVTGEMERLPEQTLILMGISGATGLSAVLISNSKSGSASSRITELQGKLGTLQPPQAALEAQLKALTALLPTANPPGSGLTPAQEAQLASLQAAFNAAQPAITDLQNEISALRTATVPAQSYGKWHAWLKDICSDANGLSFHRFQVLLWTLILGIVFVVRVCTRITMPEFDTTLLTLMGVSNGLYLGFKIPEKAG